MVTVKLSTRLSVLQSTVSSLTFAVLVHTNILVANYTQSAVGFYVTSVVKLSLFSVSVTFLPWSCDSVWVTDWNNTQATNETQTQKWLPDYGYIYEQMNGLKLVNLYIHIQWNIQRANFLRCKIGLEVWFHNLLFLLVVRTTIPYTNIRHTTTNT